MKITPLIPLAVIFLASGAGASMVPPSLGSSAACDVKNKCEPFLGKSEICFNPETGKRYRKADKKAGKKGVCLQCTKDRHCDKGVCNKENGACVPCIKNRHCRKSTQGSFCLRSTFGGGDASCKECRNNRDCKKKHGKEKRHCVSNACQSEAPECRTNSDCQEKNKLKPYCNFNECNEYQIAIGRPFIVDSEARVAETCSSSAWQQKRGGGKEEHEHSERVGLYWAQAGSYEHASIASFSRFIVQLLSLGAPAQLVEQAQAAMADEITHARLSYSLASSYLGRDVGPGPLNVTRAFREEEGLEDIVISVIREGAFGETLAAMKAKRAAEACVVPEVRSILLQIAEDEARHADLAYNFLAWVLRSQGKEMEGLVRRTFEETLHLPSVPLPSVGEEDLGMLEQGVVTAAMHSRFDHLGKKELIPDALQALLAGSPTPVSHSI